MTLLLTGVERSTPLWEMAPVAGVAAIDHMYTLVGRVLEAHHGGWSRGTDEDDTVVGTFGSAADAVGAALAVQRACAGERWPGGLRIRVRIAVHTTEVRGPERRADTEAALQRCARLREVVHGGQTVLSAATAALVIDTLPAQARLVDLGLHRLRDLSRPEQLFDVRHRELEHDFPPLRSLDVLPNNLPAQLTSFVGRGAELAEVRTLLAERRLVTLTGPGGCGKTRLAAQAVAAVADRWPDGVWWVELGAITDPALVARVVASTVRALVDPVGNPRQALASQLRGRRLLVCVDTCEHLLDAVAELADSLLRACPDVAVLATSREPLNVPGETLWRVPPLAADEGTRLFIERAALVHTSVADDDDKPEVRAICARLDGIPLAIELAAAWVRALPAAEIASRLDDRFRFLVGGPRSVPDRHRTLAASLDWSHDLLEDADRVVFRRLAVFSGGFTVEAVGAVCADDPADEVDAIGAVGRLVDKSLLVVDESERGVRFRMLDTIREFAEARLRAAAEAATTRDRFIAHFLAVAEAAEPELERDPERWRTALETEHENLRSALRWALAAPHPDRGRRLAAALARFWFIHGHTHEGLGFLEQAIEVRPDERSSLQASLLSGMGMIAMCSGRPTMAADAAERGLEIAIAAGDDRNRGRCLVVAAASHRGFFTDPAASYELACDAERHGLIAGDPMTVDLGVLLRARALTNRDRHGEAAEQVEPILERATARGDRFSAAFLLGVQVWTALFTGDLRRAEELGRRALHLAEPLGDYFTVGHMTFNLAWVRGLAGDIDSGRALIEPVIRAVADAGQEVELLEWFSLVPAKLHLWGGDLEGAAARFETAARFGEPTTDNWVVAQALPGLAEALRRMGRPGEARVQADRALTVARALSMPHVCADALDELAFLAAGEQDPVRAEDLHHAALAVRVEHGLRTFWADSLDALAATARHPAVAARLLAAGDAARNVMGYARPPVRQPEYEATVATVRAALGDSGFEDSWSQGAALNLDDAVAYATRSRGSRQRPAAGWASLTPTERQVAALVVDGLSNPEIGTRMFITRGTVKTHLAHVYAKLGIANRTELATRASTKQTTR